MARLLAGYRQLAHGAGRLLRQGRTALVWGVQVAVYPAYVAFQGMRRGYRQLLVGRPWQRARAVLAGWRQPPLAHSDTPIRALLTMIQPQGIERPGGLRPIDHHGQFLRQSRAGAVLTNGQWHVVPLSTAVRGIASDLATRNLVLVTAGNVVFDGLTTDQQDRLRRAIVLLLAEYGRSQRRQVLEQRLRHPSLPLPKAEPVQWLPFRWLNQGMRWMQTSRLAVTTNLFGEANQRWGRLRSRASTELIAPNPAQLDPTLTATPNLLAPSWSVFPSFLAPDSARAELAWVAGDRPQSLGLSQVAQPQETPTGSSLNGGQAAVGKLTTVSSGTTVPVTPPALCPNLEAIEAEATLVDYVDHPLVVLLRWLDRGIHVLETGLKAVWQWLRTHV